MKNTIDLDVPPFLQASVPDLYLQPLSILQHTSGGKVEIELRNNTLFLGRYKVSLIRSNPLPEGYRRYDAPRNKIGDKRVVNERLRWFLMANPEFIPPEWTEDEQGGNVVFMPIFFRGTLLRHINKSLYVPAMTRGSNGKWYEQCVWIGEEYQRKCAHAVLQES
jgi:hypothetical protein